LRLNLHAILKNKSLLLKKINLLLYKVVYNYYILKTRSRFNQEK
jgi:hypothetical protein